MARQDPFKTGMLPSKRIRALDLVHPAALDVASGAESEPGIKDFKKVQALLELMA